MVNSRLDGGGSDEGREIFRRSEVFILKHGGEGTPVADLSLIHISMLCSLLEHNPIIRIHFFHGSIPRSELLKLEALAANYGCEKIVFYDVRQANFEDLRVDKWASIAVYYRLLAPRLLPDTIEKVLYLDSDLIVRKSLAPLWNTDIADRPLAAVPDYIGGTAGRDLGLPDGTKYFNSGVLLMNLQYWRRTVSYTHLILFNRHRCGRQQVLISSKKPRCHERIYWASRSS